MQRDKKDKLRSRLWGVVSTEAKQFSQQSHPFKGWKEGEKFREEIERYQNFQDKRYLLMVCIRILTMATYLFGSTVVITIIVYILQGFHIFGFHLSDNSLNLLGKWTIRGLFGLISTVIGTLISGFVSSRIPEESEVR